MDKWREKENVCVSEASHLELKSTMEQDHGKAACCDDLPSQNGAKCVFATHLHQRGRVYTVHPSSCCFCHDGEVLDGTCAANNGDEIDSDSPQDCFLSSFDIKSLLNCQFTIRKSNQNTNMELGLHAFQRTDTNIGQTIGTDHHL